MLLQDDKSAATPSIVNKRQLQPAALAATPTILSETPRTSNTIVAPRDCCSTMISQRHSDSTIQSQRERPHCHLGSHHTPINISCSQQESAERARLLPRSNAVFALRDVLQDHHPQSAREPAPTFLLPALRVSQHYITLLIVPHSWGEGQRGGGRGGGGAMRSYEGALTGTECQSMPQIP